MLRFPKSHIPKKHQNTTFRLIALLDLYVDDGLLQGNKSHPDYIRARKELTEALKENTGGSEGLACAMGKQSKATGQASKSIEKASKVAGASVAILGALSAAASGLGEAFAAVKGAVN